MYTPIFYVLDKYAVLNSNFGQLSNPNLLINPDFKINQRGKSEYTESEKYTVDRWNIFIDTAHNNFVAKTSNDGVVLSGYGWFFQPIECKSLLSKKCALTAHTSIGTLTTTAEFPNTNGSTTGTVNIDGKLHMFFECNSDLPRVVFSCRTTEQITIYDVKLELGSVATPFVPPDRATELLKCQRYGELGVQYKATCRTDNYGMVDGVNFKVPKRTTPTVTLHDPYNNMDGYIYCGGDAKNYKARATGINNDGFSVYFDETGYLADAQMVVQYFADAEIY